MFTQEELDEMTKQTEVLKVTSKLKEYYKKINTEDIYSDDYSDNVEIKEEIKRVINWLEDNGAKL